jgi:SAM-dependent methyltransferase
MGSVFGPAYAGAYDATYEGKDYESECDLIEQAFDRYASRQIESVLDVGCGTGGHSLILAERGYDVIGVDQSPEMLRRARAKAESAGIRARFLEGDARTLRLDRSFDAVLLMFAVLGYQQTNEDVRDTLAAARRHLEPDGILFFDVWYGPGVLISPPGVAEREIDTPEGPVLRKATGELDVRRHLCTVRYRLGRPGEEETEDHVMRYFFPRELELFLELAGFELVSLSPIDTLEGEPGPETWNVNVVARAVSG